MLHRLWELIISIHAPRKGSDAELRSTHAFK